MNSIITTNNYPQASDPIQRIISLYLDKACKLNAEKRYNYNLVIQEFISIIKIDSIENITVDDILKYKNFLYQALRTKNYKKGTVRTKVYTVASFFRFTAMAGFTTNINNKIFLYLFEDDLPSAEPEERDVLGAVAKLDKLKEIAEPGSRVKAELSIFLNSGIRVSELIKLDCDDIYNQDDWFLLVREGKGSKRRTIKVPEEMIDDVSLYQEQNEIFEGWLFPSRKNKNNHITRKTVFLDIQQIGKEINFKLYPHLLRHVTGYLQRKFGVPTDVIGERLGHANPETTEIYTHPELLAQEEPAKRIF